MAIDFPSSPTTGQVYTYAGVTYTYTAQGVWAITQQLGRAGFSAITSASQTGVANETWTKINFPTTVFNDATLYNTTLSRWTPPVGRCQIIGSVWSSAGTLLGTPVFIAVYKNGTFFRIAINTVSGNSTGASITIIDACSGTDYYEIYAFFYSGSTVTVHGTDPGYTYFMGSML